MVVSDGDIIAIVRARESLSFIYKGLDIRSRYVLAIVNGCFFILCDQ